MIFRKAAARQIVEAFKQTYDADELIENVIVVIEKLVKDEGKQCLMFLSGPSLI
jgi:hypothetical protein